MGFTRYWNQPTKFKDEEWKILSQEVIKNYNEEEQKKYECRIIVFGDRLIIEDQSKNFYEDFRLYKEIRKPLYDGQRVAFNFVKTNQNSYDQPIKNILERASQIKEDFTCSSD